jgi:hypothetical protein
MEETTLRTVSTARTSNTNKSELWVFEISWLRKALGSKGGFTLLILDDLVDELYEVNSME